ncbi:MAG: DNA alkylation repair protein [Saprospiraceae bacterium]
MHPRTTFMSPADYYHQVRDRFRDQGKHEVAEVQMWYMRHQFDFFGLKMPQWMALTREFHKDCGIPGGRDLRELVELCFEDEHREMQYFALETLQKGMKKEPSECIDLLETLICRKSWWDTVDWIAKLTGMHFSRFPELIVPVTQRWMASGELWLQRVSLIFQLRYKDKTDVELLFRYVQQVSASKAFFLQKAAGWALREYSKTDSEAVRRFVAANRLPALAKREALKWLKKTGSL